MSTLAAMLGIAQLIDGDGTLNIDDLERFAQESGLQNRRYDYGVVAIMGPQSSGREAACSSFLFLSPYKLRERSSSCSSRVLLKCSQESRRC